MATEMLYKAAAFCAVAVSCAFARAQAAAEFCPATLVALHAVSDAGVSQVRENVDVERTSAPASDFAYHLIAQTPRNLVVATMLAETDRGWYAWRTENVPITDEIVASWWVLPAVAVSSYARSGKLSVSFPRSVMVRHAWVSEAQADGNKTGCEAPGFLGRGYDSQREPPLGETPPPSPVPWPVDALVTPVPSRAQSVNESFSTNCAKPFARVTLKEAQMPDYPYETLVEVRPYSVEVIAAVGTRNELLDSWIYYSSGNRTLDLSTLRAVRSSTYSSAVAYCRPVPGYFLFRADYWPGP
ncbi:MAG: hypothetical protein JO263_11745 [Candidatus Eremiobacteraeota bacterium]|nr:hypothetical protein [Candidatus Eremiobacteraeota bacterium]